MNKKTLAAALFVAAMLSSAVAADAAVIGGKHSSALAHGTVAMAGRGHGGTFVPRHVFFQQPVFFAHAQARAQAFSASFAPAVIFKPAPVFISQPVQFFSAPIVVPNFGFGVIPFSSPFFGVPMFGMPFFF